MGSSIHGNLLISYPSSFPSTAQMGYSHIWRFPEMEYPYSSSILVPGRTSMKKSPSGTPMTMETPI